jgi:hypothetical protein
VHEGDHGEAVGEEDVPRYAELSGEGSVEVPKESHTSAAAEPPTMRSWRWRIERWVSLNMTLPKPMFIGRGCHSFRDCGA